jgi:hypothetical protein
MGERTMELIDLIPLAEMLKSLIPLFLAINLGFGAAIVFDYLFEVRANQIRAWVNAQWN